MYVITESACARSCVHYYFSPIANFSKNQIFGSASSYGNSASSKIPHLNSPSSRRNSPSSRESSLERYSVHPDDDSSSRFNRLRTIDFQFLQFCRCPRAKKMKLNDTFECMFSLTLILANEGI